MQFCCVVTAEGTPYVLLPPSPTPFPFRTLFLTAVVAGAVRLRGDSGGDAPVTSDVLLRILVWGDPRGLQRGGGRRQGVGLGRGAKAG